ncbi:hypothetical protein [uncultured Mediterranean phage uvMED]|nr:hypothetical protein [uncultured Mediterranean phage uvMED]
MNGKQFEQLLKESALKQGLFYLRLKDAGFVGDKSDQRRFTPRNVADCVVFDSNIMAILELKKRNSSIRFDELTQYKDMIKCNPNNVDNVKVAFIVCFGDVNKVWWIDIKAIDKLKAIGKKSFNAKDCASLLSNDIYPIKTFIPARARKARLDIKTSISP